MWFPVFVGVIVSRAGEGQVQGPAPTIVFPTGKSERTPYKKENPYRQAKIHGGSLKKP
jgi:hypothetical protein